MNISKTKVWLFAAATVNIGLASQALASGYEKNILWGARSAGVAGIATPYIAGSQALYFNPAGLVNDKVGHQLSFNASPTWSQFKGPINYQNEVATSAKDFATPAELSYNWTFHERIGFGIGAYVAGGSRVNYENVVFQGIPTPANAKTNLAIYEVAAGIGYKVSDRLKLGAAWRAVMGTADFAVIGPAPNANSLINLEVNGVKATNYTGFRLGAQYKVSERTFFGLMYRSEVALKGDGTYGGFAYAVPPTATFPISTGTATTSTTFPMQLALGARHDYEKWIAMVEYSWTQYSRVDEVLVEGPYTFAGQTFQGAHLKTSWKDQHAVRIGGEYTGTGWPIRAGYIFTSKVTNEDYARATFTPPGPAHTITLGTGQTFNLMGNPLQFDAAGEYTTVKGDSANAAPAGSHVSPTTNEPIRAGTYEAVGYALHLGLTYAF